MVLTLVVIPMAPTIPMAPMTMGRKGETITEAFPVAPAQMLARRAIPTLGTQMTRTIFPTTPMTMEATLTAIPREILETTPKVA